MKCIAVVYTEVYTLIMKTTLQRWGNSQGIRIPKPLVDSIGVEVGTEVWVRLSPDQSGITITPARENRSVRGRHNIDELIDSSSPKAFDGEFDWGEPHGKEVW